jgi:hypothetical protein
MAAHGLVGHRPCHRRGLAVVGVGHRPGLPPHLLGWSMDERHDAGLVTDALQAAVATRGRSRMDSTIFHTDRGSEYTSAACIDLCDRLGLRQSMGRTGSWPGQRRRRRRVVLRHPQGRAGRPLPLPHPRPSARLGLPLDRLVQPPSAAFHQRLPTAAGVGTAAPSRPPATVNPGRIAAMSGQRGKVPTAGSCSGTRRSGGGK